MLTDIVNAIQTSTGYTPVVKGGNRSNPVEYRWSKIGVMNYRLEIDVNGSDITQVDKTLSDITEAINDFGDIGKFNGSIECNGGGTTSKDNIITMVSYYDVVVYPERTEPEPSQRLSFPITYPIRF